MSINWHDGGNLTYRDYPQYWDYNIELTNLSMTEHDKDKEESKKEKDKTNNKQDRSNHSSANVKSNSQGTSARSGESLSKPFSNLTRNVSGHGSTNGDLAKALIPSDVARSCDKDEDSVSSATTTLNSNVFALPSGVTSSMVLSSSDSKSQSNQDTSGKLIQLNKSTDFLQDSGTMIFHCKACTGYNNFKACNCDKLKDANFSILQETNKLASSKPKSNDSKLPSIGSSKSNKSNKSTSHTGGKSSATEKDASSVTKHHETSKSHSNSAKSSSSSSHSDTAKSHTKSKDSDKLGSSSSKPKSSDHLTNESKTNTCHTTSSKSKTKSESKVASSKSSSDGKSCSNGHSKSKSKEPDHSALINNVKSVAKKDQSQQKQDNKRSDSKSSSSKTSDDNSKSK